MGLVVVLAAAAAAAIGCGPPPPAARPLDARGIAVPAARPPHDVAIAGIALAPSAAATSLGPDSPPITSTWIKLAVTDDRAHSIVIERLALGDAPLAITGCIARAPNVTAPVSRGADGVTLPAGAPGAYTVEVRFAGLRRPGGRYTFAIDAAIDGTRIAIDTELAIAELRAVPVTR